MSTVLLYLAIWAIIALPFTFLAYAIFLVKENKTGKYRKIYMSAAIYFGLFLLIGFVYYKLPYMMAADVPNNDHPLDGQYVSESRDTLILDNGKYQHRYGNPAKNREGNYYSYEKYKEANEASIPEFFAVLTGNKRAIMLRTLTLQYHVVTPPAKKSTTTKGKPTYNTPTNNQTEDWYVKVNEEGLVLTNEYPSSTKTYTRIK